MRKDPNIPKRNERTLSHLFFYTKNRRESQQKRGESMVRQYRYITFADRKQIAAWHLCGDRAADMAARLGVSTAAVYRELKRGEVTDDDGNVILDRNQRPAYNPVLAQQTVQANLKRRGRTAADTQDGAGA